MLRRGIQDRWQSRNIVHMNRLILHGRRPAELLHASKAANCESIYEWRTGILPQCDLLEHGENIGAGPVIAQRGWEWQHAHVCQRASNQDAVSECRLLRLG